MRHAERAGHRGVVFELVGSALLHVPDLVDVRVIYDMKALLTFSRLAVSGSIIARTSLTSWPTLEPTSPAPIRITMLFGERLVVPALPGPVAALLTRTCVRFFVRGFAILGTGSKMHWLPKKKKVEAGGFEDSAVQ